jgi:hypothetical protein
LHNFSPLCNSHPWRTHSSPYSCYATADNRPTSVRPCIPQGSGARTPVRRIAMLSLESPLEVTSSSVILLVFWYGFSSSIVGLLVMNYFFPCENILAYYIFSFRERSPLNIVVNDRGQGRSGENNMRKIIRHFLWMLKTERRII